MPARNSESFFIILSLVFAGVDATEELRDFVHPEHRCSMGKRHSILPLVFDRHFLDLIFELAGGDEAVFDKFMERNRDV